MAAKSMLERLLPDTLEQDEAIQARTVIMVALLAGGLAPLTPAAVIHAATTPRQCGVHATLATLPGAVRAAGIRAPALIMIGEVVALDPGALLAAAATAG